MGSPGDSYIVLEAVRLMADAVKTYTESEEEGKLDPHQAREEILRAIHRLTSSYLEEDDE